jgi:hypothetical protein
MAFFDQSQELARMQDGLSWSVHLYVRTLAHCTMILPFGAISASARSARFRVEG